MQTNFKVIMFQKSWSIISKLRNSCSNYENPTAKLGRIQQKKSNRRFKKQISDSELTKLNSKIKIKEFIEKGKPTLIKIARKNICNYKGKPLPFESNHGEIKG